MEQLGGLALDTIHRENMLGMDEEKKECWDKLKHIPMTKEEKEKEVNRILQMWRTIRNRRRNAI